MKNKMLVGEKHQQGLNLRLFFKLLLFIFTLNTSCRSQHENSKQRTNQIDTIKIELASEKENVIDIKGSIIDIANGYCGVYCQGGMIEVKLSSIIESFREDTIYLITECWTMKNTDNFQAKIRETKPSDFIDNCLFEHHNYVKRYSKEKKLYKILK